MEGGIPAMKDMGDGMVSGEDLGCAYRDGLIDGAKAEREKISDWLLRRASLLAILRSLECTYGANALREAARAIEKNEDV